MDPFEDGPVGIVPRVLSHLFREVEARVTDNPTLSFSLKVQFLELYGDDLRDLLFRSTVGAKPLAIREDEHGNMQVCVCQFQYLTTKCNAVARSTCSTPAVYMNNK